METKTCIDCAKQIEELADFPGPRCLNCHALKVDKMPLQKPDFIGCISKDLRPRRRLRMDRRREHE